MATLAVLEGLGSGGFSRRNRRVSRRVMRYGVRPVDGIVYGDVDELLGRSFWKKVGSVAKSAGKLAVAPVTATYSVTKSAAKATVQAVKKPSFKNVAAIVTKPTTRAFNETKSNVREAGHAVAETGRAVKVAADVTRRVAKRIIKGIAKKVLFSGDMLGAEKPSIARISKNTAKALIMPTATAAVAANTITAPAAPVVPILVNEVVDELYSVMEKNIKKGLSPKDAEKAAKEALDRLEPGEENDPKVSGGFMPLLLGGAALAVLIIALRRRNG